MVGVLVYLNFLRASMILMWLSSSELVFIYSSGNNSLCGDALGLIGLSNNGIHGYMISLETRKMQVHAVFTQMR